MGYGLLNNNHEKYYLPFFVQDPGMHVFNFTTKSCAGWVGRAGNLIRQCLWLTVRVRSTEFGVSYFELEEHLTIYYTAFEFYFYKDRHRAARRVFTKTT